MAFDPSSAKEVSDTAQPSMSFDPSSAKAVDDNTTFQDMGKKQMAGFEEATKNTTLAGTALSIADLPPQLAAMAFSTGVNVEKTVLEMIQGKSAKEAFKEGRRWGGMAAEDFPTLEMATRGTQYSDEYAGSPVTKLFNAIGEGIGLVGSETEKATKGWVSKEAVQTAADVAMLGFGAKGGKAKARGIEEPTARGMMESKGFTFDPKSAKPTEEAPVPKETPKATKEEPDTWLKEFKGEEAPKEAPKPLEQPPMTQETPTPAGEAPRLLEEPPKPLGQQPVPEINIGERPRHPLEDTQNTANSEAARQQAEDKGINIELTRNQKRIDPWQSKVDWGRIKEFKTTGELLDHVKDHLPLDYKEIVERIAPFTEDIPLKIDNRGSARGGFYSSMDHTLNLTRKNALGNSFEVIVHEALHGATVRNYYAGLGEFPGLIKGKPEFTQAAKELNDLFNIVVESPYASDIRSAGGNVLKNPKELISWGLTDRKVQANLKRIKLGEGKTAWTEFVSKLRELLGIPKSEENALSRLIDITDRLSKEQQEGALEHGKTGDIKRDSIKTDAAETRRYKEGDNAKEVAREIYKSQGEEAAKSYIDSYKSSQVKSEGSFFKKSEEQLKKTEEEAKYSKAAEDIIRKRINDISAKERDIHNKATRLEKDIPQLERREAISRAIDTGEFGGLSPKEREVAMHVKDMLKDIGTRAQELGIVKALRENYITHIVDWEKSGIKNIYDVIGEILDEKGGGAGTSAKSRFGKERKYETFEDLNRALQESGLKLKTLDVAEIYQQYARSIERAIENKNMIESLKQITDVEGNPLLHKITDKSPAPRGWDIINSSQLQGYAIHPELTPMIKFVFENYQPNLIFRGLESISQATKRINVMGSLFHAKSLTEALLLSGFTDFAKEVVTGFKGTRDALKMFKEGGLGDKVDFLIKNGLVVEVPDDVTKGILTELGRGADNLISKFGPETKIGEKVLGNVEKVTLGLFDKLTWDFMHTGFKLQVALRELERASIKNPEIPREQLAREIASNVNNTFGGLNWFDVATRAQTKIGKEVAMAAYSPAGRRGMQLLMFAPDWTISTLRALKTAFQKGSGVKGILDPKLEADFARRYQLRNAVMYATILNLINNATADRDIWDNKDPTRIEFKDGTSMQLAKHSMEPVHWLKDPIKTLSNKLGFVPRAAYTMLSGMEYMGPGAKPLEDQSILGRAQAVAGSALPFQIRSAQTAPSGEEAKRAIMGTLGVPIYGKTKEERAKDAKRRRTSDMERRKAYEEEAKRKGWK